MSKKKTIKLLLTLEFSRGLDDDDVDDIILSLESDYDQIDSLFASEASGALLTKITVDRQQ